MSAELYSWMLTNGLRTTPKNLVSLIESLTNPADEEPYVEPTQEEIDEWMIGMMDDGGGE